VEVLGRIMLLKHPDTGALREPRPVGETERLNPRATNLAPVLLSLVGRRGSVPERIRLAMAELFPGTMVRLEPQYGRAALWVVEDGLELPPPNIADGLLKLLAIMAAVELEPSLLLIDELENSMHARMIEYVVDELNSLEVPVLVATHSPIVVGLVGPERVIIVGREPGGGTRAERITDPEGLLRRLEELGVTLSDRIFYART
jgi:predicted ATPase